MAAQELLRNHSTSYCQFYIDSKDDLADLPTSKRHGGGALKLSTPCSYGSVARDATGAKYVLTGNDQWVPFSSGGGGNTPGQSGDQDNEFGVVQF